MDIMNFIGTVMQDFRNKKPPDEASAMHNSIQTAVYTGSGSPPVFNNNTVTKAYLGMPMIYNFRDKDRKILKKQDGGRKPANYKVKSGYMDSHGKLKNGAERRASPLMISCHRAAGELYAVLCHFPAQLLPDGEKLRLEANVCDDKIGGLYNVPDTSFADSLIEEVCNRFKFPEPLIGSIPSSVSMPSPKLHSLKPVNKNKEVKLVYGTRKPIELLQDDTTIKGKILVQSIGWERKVWRCKRLYLKKDGCVGEEDGWTVTLKNVRYLGQIKAGDMLLGTQNKDNKMRLDNPERI